jgi:hypothetical protein
MFTQIICLLITNTQGKYEKMLYEFSEKSQKLEYSKDIARLPTKQFLKLARTERYSYLILSFSSQIHKKRSYEELWNDYRKIDTRRIPIRICSYGVETFRRSYLVSADLRLLEEAFKTPTDGAYADSLMLNFTKAVMQRENNRFVARPEIRVFCI